MDEKKISEVVRNVYSSSLDCKKLERLLIFTDDLWLKEDSSNQRIFEIFKNTAVDEGIEIKELVYENTGRHGAEPPLDLWIEVFGDEFLSLLDFQQLKEKKVTLEQLLSLKESLNISQIPDVVIALSYYSTSHTIFRRFLNALDTRYASMPRLEEKMFYTALNVDFLELERLTLEKKKEIEGASLVNISSDNGTEIFLEFSGRQIHTDTGNLKAKGSFGNLPAGEVYVAPLEEKTEGKFVVEYGLGKKLTPTLKIYIEKGRVVKMEGNNEMKGYLEGLFALNEKNAVVGELGIGTNKNARDVLNVLEAEKLFNTCHIALGDNSIFGGKNVATSHIDFVIFNPDMRWK